MELYQLSSTIVPALRVIQAAALSELAPEVTFGFCEIVYGCGLRRLARSDPRQRRARWRRSDIKKKSQGEILARFFIGGVVKELMKG
jgi:hypothetical protein